MYSRRSRWSDSSHQVAENVSASLFTSRGWNFHWWCSVRHIPLADGAGRCSLQPHVNTLSMVSVQTGQRPQGLAVFKHLHTDHALVFVDSLALSCSCWGRSLSWRRSFVNLCCRSALDLILVQTTKPPWILIGVCLFIVVWT